MAHRLPRRGIELVHRQPRDQLARGPQRRGGPDCLERHGIVVHTGKVVRLEGTDGRLERIVFDEGEPLERSALFFCTAQRQGSGFAAHFGARFTPHGAVKTGTAESTAIPGLYVAGDASKDAQLVIVAAAEGAEAAIAINTELTKRDLAAAR